MNSFYLNLYAISLYKIVPYWPWRRLQYHDGMTSWIRMNLDPWYLPHVRASCRSCSPPCPYFTIRWRRDANHVCFFGDPIQVSPKSRHVLSQVSSMPLTGICDPEVASNGRHCHRGGIVDRFMQSGEQTNEQARARAQSMTSLMVTTRIYVWMVLRAGILRRGCGIMSWWHHGYTAFTIRITSFDCLQGSNLCTQSIKFYFYPPNERDKTCS